MNIYSNIGIGNRIEIIAINGEPRKIISEILHNFQGDIILIGLIFVGKRVIINNNLHLLKGRRHRKYFGIKFKNKITIRFGWHKIKNFTDSEMKDLLEHWSFNFFETTGKYLIEKSGGVLSFNNMIYSKSGIIIK